MTIQQTTQFRTTVENLTRLAKSYEFDTRRGQIAYDAVNKVAYYQGFKFAEMAAKKANQRSHSKFYTEALEAVSKEY